MKDRTPSIEELFRPLIGVPSWNVKKGHGSFLTFEFGTPRLEIREPRQSSSANSTVRKHFARRQVTVCGQWHLWIYCCRWRISMEGSELAHDESTDEQIAAACRQIDGQAIREVMCVPKLGRSRFCFDLGGVLETGPYSDELSEQWLLYLPDGNVYTYRSDGAVSFGPGESHQEEWTNGG